MEKTGESGWGRENEKNRLSAAESSAAAFRGGLHHPSERVRRSRAHELSDGGAHDRADTGTHADPDAHALSASALGRRRLRRLRTGLSP